MIEYPVFYSDKKNKIINKHLFSDVAEFWAENVHKEAVDERGREKNLNKRSQIRKFYDEVVRYNEIVKRNKDEWSTIHPFVNMIIAKVVYAEGRKLVSSKFVDLIKNCVKQVEDPEDLDVFTNFFEAFMGFYRKYGS